MSSASQEPGRTEIKPAVPCTVHKLCRVNIRFNKYGRLALVDSGSAVTLLSADLFSRLSSKQVVEKSQHRQTFNSTAGEPLLSLGCYLIPFKIKTLSFSHAFHIIQGLQEQCILGIDFLKDNNLVLDLSQKQMIDEQDGERELVPLADSTLYCINVSPQEKTFDISHLNDEEKAATEPILESYKHLFVSTIKELGCTTLIEHHIETEGPPVNVQPYGVPITLRPFVREYLQDLLDSGVIQKSTSPYRSPACILQKKGKSPRWIGDFRALKKNDPAVQLVYPANR